MVPTSQGREPRVAQIQRTFSPGVTQGFPAPKPELLTENSGEQVRVCLGWDAINKSSDTQETLLSIV